MCIMVKERGRASIGGKGVGRTSGRTEPLQAVIDLEMSCWVGLESPHMPQNWSSTDITLISVPIMEMHTSNYSVQFSVKALVKYLLDTYYMQAYARFCWIPEIYNIIQHSLCYQKATV